MPWAFPLMLACSRAFMLPCTFALALAFVAPDAPALALAGLAAGVAAGVAAVLAVFAAWLKIQPRPFALQVISCNTTVPA